MKNTIQIKTADIDLVKILKDVYKTGYFTYFKTLIYLNEILIPNLKESGSRATETHEITYLSDERFNLVVIKDIYERKVRLILNYKVEQTNTIDYSTSMLMSTQDSLDEMYLKNQSFFRINEIEYEQLEKLVEKYRGYNLVILEVDYEDSVSDELLNSYYTKFMSYVKNNNDSYLLFDSLFILNRDDRKKFNMSKTLDMLHNSVDLCAFYTISLLFGFNPPKKQN